MRKLRIAGNWKMNHAAAATVDFCRDLRSRGLKGRRVDILLFPSFTSIPVMLPLLQGTAVQVGGQNLHQEIKGAYTGEISAAMLKEASCTHVLIGHSERRQYFNETNAGVNAKARVALEHGLTPIICIGETREEREGGVMENIIETQLRGALEGFEADKISKLMIAYEPVWAIGTGLTASPEQAQEVHAYIRKLLVKIAGKDVADRLPILYGGSAKPDNAAQLLSEVDIDGLLIGGASLKVDDFFSIIEIADTINK